MAEALAYDVLLYLQIQVDEVGPIERVGHDATHMGGRQHHMLGLLLIKESLDGYPVHQVQLPVRAPYDIGIALGLQIVVDG